MNKGVISRVIFAYLVCYLICLRYVPRARLSAKRDGL